MLTSLSRGAFSLACFRSLLAVGESGAWPSFAKAVAIWIPINWRAMAMGICNAGSSLGATIAPIIVVFLTHHFGWRGAFLGDRFYWFPVGSDLSTVSLLSPAAESERTGTVPQRQEGKSKLADAAALPADLGSVRGPLSGGSPLVLFHFLDAGVSDPGAGAPTRTTRGSGLDTLRGSRHRKFWLQDGWRLHCSGAAGVYIGPEKRLCWRARCWRRSGSRLPFAHSLVLDNGFPVYSGLLLDVVVDHCPDPARGHLSRRARSPPSTASAPAVQCSA